MKRLLMASAFFVSVYLLALSFWLLINPGTALAATGSADCGGGQKVQCCVDCSKVTRCDCQDGVGCTVTYDDNSTRKKLCSSFDGPPVEETAN